MASIVNVPHSDSWETQALIFGNEILSSSLDGSGNLVFVTRSGRTFTTGPVIGPTGCAGEVGPQGPLFSDFTFDASGNLVATINAMSGMSGSQSAVLAAIKGSTGCTGASGFGFRDVSIDRQGNIHITLPDGQTGILKAIKGERGEPGPIFSDFVVRPDGSIHVTLGNGSTGILSAIRGPTGPAGFQFEDISFNASGCLTVTLPGGASGTVAAFAIPGPTGRGVKGFSGTVSSGLTVNYTDNTSQIIDPLNSSKVAYCVSVFENSAAFNQPITFTTTPQTVKFSTAIFGEGITFVPKKGAMAIPFDGVYKIWYRFGSYSDFATLRGLGSPPASMDIFVNGSNVVGASRPLNPQYGGYCAQQTIILRLKTGDHIDVRYSGLLTPHDTIMIDDWEFGVKLEFL